MEKYFSVNAEGCSIRCKLYAGESGAVERVVLFGHGFGGHKDNRAAARFAGRMLEKNKGTALVTFDWPCHGEDVRKVLRLEDCAHYLRLMLAHIRARFQDPALLGYATSFGGYLFLEYLSEEGLPFERLALRCPAVTVYESLRDRIISPEEWKKIEKGKPVPVGFDRKVNIDAAFLEELRQADVAKRDYFPWADELMILQGTKDEIVPFEAVKAFAEANVIDFIPVEGADHRFQDPRKMDIAIARMLAFFGMK